MPSLRASHGHDVPAGTCDRFNNEPHGPRPTLLVLRVNPITATTVIGHQSVDELGAIAFVVRRGRDQ